MDNEVGNALLIFSNFAGRTNIHAVPKILSSEGIFRRFTWLTVCFFSTGCLLWQLSICAIRFYRYDTITTFTNTENAILEFPAVTFCNMNSVKLSKATLLTNQTFYNLAMKLHQYYDADRVNTIENKTTDSLQSNTENFTALYEEMRILFNEMSHDDAVRISTSIHDILFDCQFISNPCFKNEFVTFYDRLYGNCFIFNVNFNSTRYVTSKAGRENGLSLVLDINQTDYPSVFSDSAGIHMIVHPVDQYPIPEYDGFSVMPGVETSIAISKKTLKRMEPPYGTCRTLSEDEARAADAYYDWFGGGVLKYGHQTCTVTCKQRQTMMMCGCRLPDIPYYGNAFISINDNRTIDLSTCSKILEADCSREIEKKFLNGELDCDRRCPLPCLRHIYDISISTAQWPSFGKKRQMIALEQMKDITKSREEISNYIDQSMMKINLFYNTMSVDTIEESSEYTINQLLSDVGGQMGLWLGISVAALFEIVELMIDIGIHIIRTLISVKKNKEHLHKNPCLSDGIML